MRAIWILAGVVGGASAVAVASPNALFYTVINQGDAIAGSQFLGPEQVVVGDGGVVATIGQLENGNNLIIYSTPLPGNQWSSQTVIEDNTPTNVSGLSGSQQFSTYDNLALTSNPSGGARLTFLTYTLSDEPGILQWDDNSGITSLGDVALAGNNGYTDVGPEFQVNGSGQVLFPAAISSNPVLVRGDRSSATTVFADSLSSTIVNPTNTRVALGTDNSGIEELDSSGTDGIYKIAAGGGAVTPPLSGSLTPSSDQPIIGYASGNGLNSYALMVVNGSTSGSLDMDLSKNLGAPQSILAHQFTTSSDNYTAPAGEITPNGQIAVYVPNDNGAGDTIQYLNAVSGGATAAVIAAVGTVARDPSGTNLNIQALQQQVSAGGSLSWVPEINSGGTIVFTAEVGTSPSDEKQAILDWLPGDASPEIILAVGDTVDIDGESATIDGFEPNQLLPQDNDYFRNSLSDDNYLAVQVGYTYDAGPDEGDSGSAVIITQLATEVPEPATLALLPIVGVGLLARRRRCC